MRDIRFALKPRYAKSRALVIGINDYQICPPLGYAVNDAKAIHAKLLNDFGFEECTLLLDEQATAHSIRKAYLRFVEEDLDLDERLLIFFAGHGDTRRGMRGEIGYLVPVDGNPRELNTLIRWDELTRNVDLIRAKHILFIMDACYGGLAVTRSVHAGSARFLRDMLKRVSRQVLTAGKADEVVADSGGPLEGHSVFTGHLLQGLDGAAATQDGVLTASGLMSYVYGKVGSDAGSVQTPHFGHIDGDGDFIFRAPALESDADEHRDIDELLVVPYPEEPTPRYSLVSKVTRVKALLSESEKAIELHDFAVDEVKHFLSTTSEDFFSVDGAFSVDELLRRLARYEEAIKDLATIEACIAYWASPAHKNVLRKILSRSTDRHERKGGLSVWLNLRWYPLILQTYCAGIAAVEAGRYDSLAELFLAEIHDGEQSRPLHQVIGETILEFNRADLFKKIPGHENHYSPMSEYLFKLLQPQLDDALFLGRNYETSFDEFEVLLALVTADRYLVEDRYVWGPIGRFGWKHGRGRYSPLNNFIEKAKREGDKWPAVTQGLFGGDSSRFVLAADEFTKIISNLSWH